MIKQTTTATRELLLAEVKRRGWGISFFDVDYGFIEVMHPSGKSMLFWTGRPNVTGGNSVDMAMYKSVTYNFMQSRGIKPIPFMQLEDATQAVTFLEKHGTVVVKPNNLAKSIGVTIGITNKDSLFEAIDKAKKYSEDIIIQKLVSGRHYRLIVIDGKLFCATERRTTTLVGDGYSTVQELIEAENKNPLRGDTVEHQLYKIDTVEVAAILGENELRRIPAANEKVALSKDQSSYVGELRDVTDIVHTKIKEVAEYLSLEMGLFVNGLDIITEDIASYDEDRPFPIIEVNSKPNLKLVREGAVGAILDAAFKHVGV